jgi:hypothetical protein
MFGWAVDKMTIWKSVQQIGSKHDFMLDANEEPHGEADGTGVGIVLDSQTWQGIEGIGAVQEGRWNQGCGH